jgi:hypothetical protein
MPMPMPTDSTRWRCTGCGNLTRFDVVRRAVVREFWRQDLGGTPAIEESEALASEIESVTCCWCGRADVIELVARCAFETADVTAAEQAEPGRS